MNQKEAMYLNLIGLMLQELGGRFDISQKSQVEYNPGEKELLIKHDPKTGVMSIKTQKKHKVKG